MPTRWSSAWPWRGPRSPSPSATATGGAALCGHPGARCGSRYGAAGAPRASWGAISATMRCPSMPSAKGVRLSGYAGLPTFNKATSAQQFLFVNGRPVRDSLLAGAVRGAYADFLARDRHPAVALFLELRSQVRGRECPSRQDRSALPRCRAGARADRRRAEPCPGRRRPSRLDHRGRRRVGSFRPGGAVSSQPSFGESAWRGSWPASAAVPRGLRGAGGGDLCALRRLRAAARPVLDESGSAPAAASLPAGRGAGAAA